MQTGRLIKVKTETILWPSMFREGGTTFNKHPHVKEGEIVMILDEESRTSPALRRVKILSSVGPGWVSIYSLEDAQ